jgi:hypothetical protein
MTPPLNNHLIRWPLTCRGFFSEYNVLLWVLLYCRLYGYDFALDVTPSSIVSAEFAKDLLRVSVYDAKTAKQSERSHPARALWNRLRLSAGIPSHPQEALFRRLWSRRYEQKLAKSLDLLPALCQLHHEVWSDEAARNRAAIDPRMRWLASCQYIGFHIRRGDKLLREARYVPVSAFVSEIPATMLHMPILVCTDDYTAVEETRRYLESRGEHVPVLSTATPEERGHSEADFRLLTISEREARIGRVLCDFGLLKGSAHFVGSFSSNLSRAVHVARAGLNSRSVDTVFTVVQ